MNKHQSKAYFWYAFNICAALGNLELLQFRKREKHPWRIATFSKVAGKSLQRY